MTPRDLWRENMRQREIAKRAAVRLRKLAPKPAKPSIAPQSAPENTAYALGDVWRKRG